MANSHLKPLNNLPWSTFSLIGFLVTLLFVFGFQFGYSPNKSELPQTQSATVLSKPRPITPFQLVDQNNQPFTQNNLKNHWSVLFFGFTSCPHICPTTMSTLNKVFQEFQKADVSEPQFIFVSVDPERDTPAKINQYIKSFNKNFTGLTGKESEIAKLTNNLNVLFVKTMTKNNSNSGNATAYNIDHSGTLMLINPQGQLAAFFSMPHDAKVIAQDISSIRAR